jgi:serpin B
MGRSKVLVVTTLVVGLVASACGGSSVEDTGPGRDVTQKREPGVLGADLQRAAAVAVPDAQLQAYLAGQNKFAIELYRLLAARDDKNFAISPESLTTALTMLLAGTSGTARTELAHALGVEDLIDASPEIVNALLHDLESRTRNGVTLEEANRIYSDPKFVVKAQFVEVLAQQFGAPMVNVNFEGDPEGARKAINAWVSDKTREKIPELFPEGSIDSSTVVTLVNAVYLKAKWKNAFAKERTHDAEFTTADGAKVQVPMMAGDDINAVFGDGFAAAELPYAGDELSMIVIVPDELAAFEKALDPARLDSIVKEAGRGRPSDFFMPRFEVKGGGEMTDFLKQLGIKGVFAKGGLANLSDDPRIEVSTVQHQVYVRVDEEGTEAAAATGIGIRATSLGPPPFIANKPFLYAVRDKQTGALLFLGRITNPFQS